MKLYEKLGVSENASPEEIKKAHKKKAKENHPDKGGDNKKFQEIQKAYEVLINPEKRKHYDDTGEVEQEQSTYTTELISYLNMVIVEKIEGSSSLEFDLIKYALAKTKDFIKGGEANVKSFESKLSKFEKAKAKVKRRGNQPNFVSNILEQKIDLLKNRIKETEAKIDFLKRAHDDIATFEWEFDEPAAKTTWLNFHEI